MRQGPTVGIYRPEEEKAWQNKEPRTSKNESDESLLSRLHLLQPHDRANKSTPGDRCGRPHHGKWGRNPQRESDRASGTPLKQTQAVSTSSQKSKPGYMTLRIEWGLEKFAEKGGCNILSAYQIATTEAPKQSICPKCGREVGMLRPSGLCGFCDDDADYAANREGDQDESP